MGLILSMSISRNSATMFGIPSEIISFLELIGYLAAIVTLILGIAKIRLWLSRGKSFDSSQPIQQKKTLLPEKKFKRRVRSRIDRVYGYSFIILSPIAGIITYIIPDNPHGKIHILPVFLRPKIIQGILIFTICILIGIGIIIYSKIKHWINNPYE